MSAAFGVYVHWPYCARICPYCDFNVYRQRGADPGRLIAAIAQDLAAQAALTGPLSAQTVFLGGGTPSLLSGAEIAALLAAVDQAFPIAAEAEITLEANPEDAARFPEAVAAGVNRLSLGVQALDDAALKALGRAHDASAGRAAVRAAAAVGARVSLDLIYARDGQTAAAWGAELAEALALPAEHLSLYQLTIEAGTAFERAVARGRVRPPGAELAADLFELTQALCDRAGLPAYEISNHARGPSAQSRHNLLYWRGAGWAGAGPGAHGRLPTAQGRLATRTHARPEAYIAAAAAGGPAFELCEVLAPETIAEERLLMGLRLAEGLDPQAVSALALESQAAALRAEGLLEAGPRLTLTPRGRLLADRVAALLAAG